MDDSGTPANNPQIEPQDGCHPGDSVESVVIRLPSVSDENENRLDGNGHEHLTSSSCAMGKPEVLEQDSLNNNESCMSSCEVAAGESSENTPCEDPRDGQTLGMDKKISAKRSSRSKKGTAKKIPPGLSSGDITPSLQEKTVHAAMRAGADEETAGVNANDEPEVPKLVLQSLFSLIRGEVEQLDSRALPLCLHQMAESYFQEEDYEKAMKFIQLERLYHEQLLANLSAIQKQWETKWKTVQPHTVTSLRNSEKGFNSEDFERLSKFCTTHQDPLLSKQKTAAMEKSLGRKCFMQLIVSEDRKEKGITAKESEGDACLDQEPGEEGHVSAAAAARLQQACAPRRPAPAGERGEGERGEGERGRAQAAPAPSACGACGAAPGERPAEEAGTAGAEPARGPGAQRLREELQLPLPAEARPPQPRPRPGEGRPRDEDRSPEETPPSDDGCLSLDELAKRIEIAEVVPAEGLVSILKKRSDSVGNHSAQMQQKPSKRRVRFQEIEDNLDQDEVGGGSCILLILLCLATVFLSVGGTALYCAFGDIESPVCTDFADNVDFYYTKIVQGMAELKHWLYLS
ncbi:consortin [Dasypus novemcinctus]|uniref:consortin n=1 Tax=Dasypus novemcinctus TaxID=9361 RepID=UPI00265DFAA7|nr:consortin [Dasypus novemcinctus]XP_058165374.1 consortin [Dasypus novemcinctus]XP_058165375.1 consortin [Dasypus novemcinctus]